MLNCYNGSVYQEFTLNIEQFFTTTMCTCAVALSVKWISINNEVE